MVEKVIALRCIRSNLSRKICKVREDDGADSSRAVGSPRAGDGRTSR